MHKSHCYLNIANTKKGFRRKSAGFFISVYEKNRLHYPPSLFFANLKSNSVTMFQALCMIMGGIKYTSQRFNPKSASVTAIFMFVYISGIVYHCGRNQVYISEI